MAIDRRVVQPLRATTRAPGRRRARRRSARRRTRPARRTRPQDLGDRDVRLGHPTTPPTGRSPSGSCVPTRASRCASRPATRAPASYAPRSPSADLRWSRDVAFGAQSTAQGPGATTLAAPTERGSTSRTQPRRSMNGALLGSRSPRARLVGSRRLRGRRERRTRRSHRRDAGRPRPGLHRPVRRRTPRGERPRARRPPPRRHDRHRTRRTPRRRAEPRPQWLQLADSWLLRAFRCGRPDSRIPRAPPARLAHPRCRQPRPLQHQLPQRQHTGTPRGLRGVPPRRAEPHLRRVDRVRGHRRGLGTRSSTTPGRTVAPPSLGSPTTR